MTDIKISLNLMKGIKAFCQATIGRTPVFENTEDARDMTQGMLLRFIPDLTTTEKQTLNSALPDWFKKIFNIEVL